MTLAIHADNTTFDLTGAPAAQSLLAGADEDGELEKIIDEETAADAGTEGKDKGDDGNGDDEDDEDDD